MASGNGPSLCASPDAAKWAATQLAGAPRAAEASKISKSYRRKQRDRRVAVRRALRNSVALGKAVGAESESHLELTTALKETVCFGGQLSQQAPNVIDGAYVVDMIYTLDAKLNETLRLMNMMCIRQGIVSEEFGIAEPTTAAGSKLNPDAASFVPMSTHSSAPENATTASSYCYGQSDGFIGGVECCIDDDSTSSKEPKWCLLPSVATWLHQAPAPLARAADSVGTCIPVFRDVPGSGLFNVGDKVIVVEGDMSSHLGEIVKLGGVFEVYEEANVSTFESLYSVKLQSDPDGASVRLFRQGQLEIFECEPRIQLRRGLDKCIQALEGQLFPRSCTELLVPLLRKGAEIAKNGTAARCAQVDAIINSRLDQLAQEIFAGNAES